MSGHGEGAGAWCVIIMASRIVQLYNFDKPKNRVLKHEKDVLLCKMHIFMHKKVFTKRLLHIYVITFE